MPRKKKMRKEEVKNLENVFCDADWFRNFFIGNNSVCTDLPYNDVVLELGCGYGEYSISLAQKFPEKLFIGVDVKSDRLWVAAQNAKKLHLKNLIFINTHVLNLNDFFTDNSISEIWITFPDPQPKEKNEKHRLTSTKFLEIYKKILKSNGIIHFKTDHQGLFDYTATIFSKLIDAGQSKMIKKIDNIYALENVDEILKIQTRFEKKHLTKGDKIKYLCFCVNCKN